jgi:hypothetical protein
MRGLTKAFKLKSGVSGVYWAPTNAHVHCESNKIEVRLELFHTKAEYEAGAASMGEVRNVVLTLPVEICDSIDSLMGEVQLQDAEKQGQEIKKDQTKPDPGFFADSVMDKEVKPTRADPTPGFVPPSRVVNPL